MGKTTKLQAFPKHPLPNVLISNRQKALPIRKRAVASLVQTVLEFLNVSCEEVAIYFVTKKRIAELHSQFFNDPTPTDCISFPMDQDFLGEVFVCPEVAIEYAKKRALDPKEETLLYVIHGLLHLIGFDDIAPKEKRLMRKMEKQCMKQIHGLAISL